MKKAHRLQVAMVLSIGIFSMKAAAQNSFPASGDVVVTGNIHINTPGVNNSNGLYAGNGDGASDSTADVAVESWWGLGFKSTCCSSSGITWNYPIMFDTRAGNIYAEGNIGIGTTTPGYNLDVFTTVPPGMDAYSGLQIRAGNYGYLIKGGLKQGAGAILTFSANNNGTINEKVRIDQSGNVGIGTTSPSSSLEVNGSVKLSSGSGASMTFQDGSVQSVAWNGVLSGGDYAESVDVIGDRKAYEPGDVLVIDPTVEGKFLKSSHPYSTNVLGVYSTKPGVVGRRQTSGRSHMAEEVPMAMVGVIPTKVCAEGGPIKPGDLLVTSSIPGYAMKGTDRTQMLGAIIGKALGHLDVGTGVMEVGVSIQ